MKYESDGLSILAFPSNQFGSQEPGTNEEIKQFAQGKYGATFDLFAKIDVNGNNAAPIFSYLKDKQHGTLGNAIKWNFSKFLVNRAGIPVKRHGPLDDPFKFEDEICKELGVAKKA